jgi:hypothetical protein
VPVRRVEEHLTVVQVLVSQGAAQADVAAGVLVGEPEAQARALVGHAVLRLDGPQVVGGGAGGEGGRRHVGGKALVDPALDVGGYEEARAVGVGESHVARDQHVLDQDAGAERVLLRAERPAPRVELGAQQVLGVE